MVSAQYISIGAAVLIAFVFIYFLTKRKPQQDPDLQKPSLVKGFAAIFNGDDKRALEELRGIALAGKGAPDTYLAIGFLYRKMGEYTKAAQMHEVLLTNKEIDQSYRKLLITELAKDYLLGDMPVKALSLLKETADQDRNPENLTIMARASLAVKNTDNAIAYNAKFQKITGTVLVGFFAKCMIEKAMQSPDLSKSAKFIKSALADSPRCRPARFINAGIFSKEGKHIKASNEYKQIVLEGLWRDMRDIATIQSAMITTAHESDYLNTLQDLALGESQDPFVYIALAKFYISNDKHDDARKTFERYLSRKKSKVIAAKEYATLFDNEIVANLSEGQKSYICTVCSRQYDQYHDDCPFCRAFDSIVTK